MGKHRSIPQCFFTIRVNECLGKLTDVWETIRHDRLGLAGFLASRIKTWEQIVKARATSTFPAWIFYMLDTHATSVVSNSSWHTRIYRLDFVFILLLFMDTVILWIISRIDRVHCFRGDLTDTAAETKSLLCWLAIATLDLIASPRQHTSPQFQQCFAKMEFIRDSFKLRVSLRVVCSQQAGSLLF